MRVLLMGDASNCHRTLATGLRQLGCDVTVASDGTAWMQTERDIDLRRRFPSKAGGLDLWLRLNSPSMRRRLSGYDIVAISGPIFLGLRPHRVREIFDRLRRDNRMVFLTAMQTDTPYVEECLDPSSPVRYNEFRHYGHPAPHAIAHPDIERAWLSDPLKSHCDYIYNNIDGAVSILYEYHRPLLRRLPAEKTAYSGIPIDTDSLKPVELPERPEKVRLFLGRHADRMPIKGTDRFEIAARKAIERHPGCAELIIVENRPYKEYLELLKSAHVVIDQAYSYSPATNALLAMSYGLNTISGGEPEFYNFIGEHENRPIINAPTDVEGMTRMFEDIILHPEELRRRGRASRTFVETHNAMTTVARRFLDFWTSKMNSATDRHDP